MKRVDGIDVWKVCFIYTKDLDFVEHNSCDTHPYQVYVDEDFLNRDKDVQKFLEDYPKDKLLLRTGNVDYIIIEYDM